jgi:hypothetical protein
VKSLNEYTYRVSFTSVYNLSPYRYTKDTPYLPSGKFIKEAAQESSLILERASETSISRSPKAFLTDSSY